MFSVTGSRQHFTYLNRCKYFASHANQTCSSPVAQHDSLPRQIQNASLKIQDRYITSNCCLDTIAFDDACITENLQVSTGSGSANSHILIITKISTSTERNHSVTCD